eukprot:scaffold909_cov121-Isochrysis_galbana.AAC.14
MRTARLLPAFQAQGAGAIRPAVCDPCEHSRATGAHAGDAHSKHLTRLHFLQFLQEGGYFLLQHLPHLGGRALARQRHLDRLGSVYYDDIEGLHAPAHSLKADANVCHHK